MKLQEEQMIPTPEEAVTVADAAAITPTVVANSNDPQAAKPTPISKKKKILSAIFNMAVGAVATMGAKALVTTAMIGCPPLALLLMTSFAVGATMTMVCHEGQRRKAKKENGNAPDFFSKQNMKNLFCSKASAKVFVKSSLFACIGGALVLGFQEGIIQEGLGKLFGSSPAPAVIPAIVSLPIDPAPIDAAPVELPPVVDVAPVVAPCLSPVEHFMDAIKDRAVSDRVADAMDRVSSANPRVAAQGAKDLAYFAFNGFGGVPKDPAMALELFQKAADAGNVQAKIDLLYMQFHGLAGVPADPQAAVEAMQEIKSPRAGLFVEKWAAMGQHVTDKVVGFDSKAILHGVKLCAPAA